MDDSCVKRFLPSGRLRVLARKHKLERFFKRVSGNGYFVWLEPLLTPSFDGRVSIDKRRHLIAYVIVDEK